MLKMLKLIKNRLYNEHYPSILVTFLGETEHFSRRIGALRWSILMGKQKHNVQKPTRECITGLRSSLNSRHPHRNSNQFSKFATLFLQIRFKTTLVKRPISNQ